MEKFLKGFPLDSLCEEEASEEEYSALVSVLFRSPHNCYHGETDSLR